MQWIDVNVELPKDNNYILLSYENFDLLDVDRYETDDNGGTFYPGDYERSCSSFGLVVNAWAPMPEPYRPSEDPEPVSDVISLLAFLRSLPAVFDWFKVDIKVWNFKSCSVCSRGEWVLDELYSSCDLDFINYRKDALDDTCIYLHHLRFPHLYNLITQEFVIKFEQNKITIEHYLHEPNDANYICKGCEIE